MISLRRGVIRFGAEGEAMHRKILKFQTLNGKIKKLTDLFIYSL